MFDAMHFQKLIQSSMSKTAVDEVGRWGYVSITGNMHAKGVVGDRIVRCGGVRNV